MTAKPPEDSPPTDGTAASTTRGSGEAAYGPEFLLNPTPLSPSPVIALKRIDHINTYEVMEADLDDLDRASTAENQALAFAMFCSGALISTVLSWIALSSPSTLAIAVYLSSTLVLLVASLHFILTWLREKRSRERLLQRIRSQTATTIRGRS